MSRRDRRRSGFITALAITMIALIAVALAMLTARVNTVARQAMQERQRAQAEELVLAGIEAVRAEPAVRAMAVPEGVGSVTITAREGRVVIEAVVGRTRVAREVDVKER